MAFKMRADIVFRLPAVMFCAEAELLSAVAADDASSDVKFVTSVCEILVLLALLPLLLVPQLVFNTHDSASRPVTTILLFISIVLLILNFAGRIDIRLRMVAVPR